MRFVVGFALLAFGTCQTGTAPTTPPEETAADTAAEDFAAEDEGASAEAGEAEADEAGAGEAEAGEAGAGEAGEAGASAEAGEAGEIAAGTSGEPAEDGGAAPTGDDAGEPAPAFALPKKVYTKVDAKCGKDKGVGSKLKAFKLATPSGKSVTHRSYGNRVLLVNFWGTWCKPCLKELPEFDRLYRRYRKHGLVAIAIATDEEAEPVQAFVDSRKLSTRVLIGGEDYAGQYGAPTFPFTYVVDAQGVIRASYHGYKPECMGKLEADIREQLEKRASKK
jgi:thiol-disulfide isomerase/thioredoxin